MIHINTEKEYSTEKIETLKQTFQYIVALLDNDNNRKEQIKQNLSL